MRISHLGNSAVLVETRQVRILIDPGNIDPAWHDITDLDAVLATHIHPDHFDPEQVGGLRKANPGAAFYLEPSIVDAMRAGQLPDLQAKPLGAGEEVTVADLHVQAVGGQHAIIHRDIPRVGNVGLVLSAPGEPTLFHPGDSYDTAPEGIDLLATPAYGPWAAMKETIDFVRAVGAPRGFRIHDGLLNERGRALVQQRIGELTSTQLDDLSDHQPHDY